MHARHKMTAEVKEKVTVFTRLIDAPRELVWKAWTHPVMLRQWWGPQDFTCPSAELDLRVGGTYRFVMRGPDGAEFPVKGVFLEIVSGEKLVMTDNADHMPDEWLKQAQSLGSGDGTRLPDSFWTVTFEARGRQTLITLSTHFSSNADRDAMIKMGMEGGWAESLDKLDSAVAAALVTAVAN
jgi:uncharacterized protein YndB with AHSA1/START domain